MPEPTPAPLDAATVAYLAHTPVDIPCPNCRFNLKGCPSPRCPECGEPITFTTRTSRRHRLAHIIITTVCIAEIGHGVFTAIHNLMFLLGGGVIYSLGVEWFMMAKAPLFAGLLLSWRLQWRRGTIIQTPFISVLVLAAFVLAVELLISPFIGF